jgi:uncharacterized protein YkwD
MSIQIKSTSAFVLSFCFGFALISCQKNSSQTIEPASTQSNLPETTANLASGDDVAEQVLPQASPTPSTPPLLTSCGNMNPQSCEIFSMVNMLRTQKGLSPLELNEKCIAAAQAHAKDMFERRFFSHDSPTESWTERMTRYGLTGGAVGENIAQSSTAQQAFSMWSRSPGHYQNMTSKSFRTTGVGYYSGLWVQCFYTPR